MTFLAAWSLAKRFWPVALIGLCTITLLIAGLRIQSVERERDEARRTVAEQQAQLATLQTDANAKEAASMERATDAAKDTATQKETADALRTAADPGRALSCLRLKRAGVTPLPAECRS